MEASDIEITLGGGTLLIQGGRGEGESTGAAGLDLGPPFFRKMIPIPFSIDVQNATAVFKDRVLKVMLPRLTAEYPARIRIPIKP
jgi:HSP20 family molecular chaperone IbpA